MSRVNRSTKPFEAPKVIDSRMHSVVRLRTWEVYLGVWKISVHGKIHRLALSFLRMQRQRWPSVRHTVYLRSDFADDPGSAEDIPMICISAQGRLQAIWMHARNTERIRRHNLNKIRFFTSLRRSSVYGRIHLCNGH